MLCSLADGHWSLWTPWGQCSVSCGAGFQSRYRFCSSLQRSGSSPSCLGAHREDQVCVMTQCDRESFNKQTSQYHRAVVNHRKL